MGFWGAKVTKISHIASCRSMAVAFPTKRRRENGSIVDFVLAQLDQVPEEAGGEHLAGGMGKKLNARLHDHAEQFMAFLRHRFPDLLDNDTSRELLVAANKDFIRMVELGEALEIPAGAVINGAKDLAAIREANARARSTYVAKLPEYLTEHQWVRRFGFTRHGYEALERLLGSALLPKPKAAAFALRPRETLMMVVQWCRSGKKFNKRTSTR